jgi:predicted ATPase
LALRIDILGERVCVFGHQQAIDLKEDDLILGLLTPWYECGSQARKSTTLEITQVTAKRAEEAWRKPEDNQQSRVRHAYKRILDGVCSALGLEATTKLESLLKQATIDVVEFREGIRKGLENGNLEAIGEALLLYDDRMFCAYPLPVECDITDQIVKMRTVYAELFACGIKKLIFSKLSGPLLYRVVHQKYEQIRRSAHLGSIGQKVLTAYENNMAERAFHIALPAPEASSAEEAIPNNLTVEPASLIGREEDLSHIKRLLGTGRMVTLKGGGGVGKTVLMKQVAREILREPGSHYRDGVWFVDLASITDRNLVPVAVASSLHFREHPGKAVEETVVDELRSKEILLLLDNCEHQIDACAKLATDLLRGCKGLQILATSREPLGISGEVVWRVPSLSFPDSTVPPIPAEIEKYTAVQLFLIRTREAGAEFVLTEENASAVVQICRQLDGIPLALELAAARMKILSAEKISAALTDCFRLLNRNYRDAVPRHKTLRAAIDWSYDLLPDQERALLHRLSVFRGGWTLNAAERVCIGRGIEDWEILDLLASLADKSLIVYEQQEGAGRYRLLEIIRQYAAEKLSAGDEERLYRKKHRDYFLDLATEINPKLGDPEQAHWLDVLEAEYDNLDLALDFCLENSEETEEGLRLGAALQQFWWTRGHLSRERERLMVLLSHPLAQEHTKARAAALNGAGVLARMLEDYVSAHSLHEESLRIYRELDDKQAIAYSLGNLGIVACLQEDYASARPLFEESLERHRELENEEGIAYCLGNLGTMAYHQGDYASARSLMEQSLEIQQKLDHPWGIAGCHDNLGNMDRIQGDLVSARTQHEKSLMIRKRLEDKPGIALCLESFASLAFTENRSEQAAHLSGASERLREEIGSSLTRLPDEQAVYVRHLEEARQSLGEERLTEAWAEGRAMTLEQAIEYALGRPDTL